MLDKMKIANNVITRRNIKERLFRIQESDFYNPNCIDGRDTDNYRPSIAWWKIWVLMAVLKTLDELKINNDRKKETITFLNQYFGWFGFHSDTHVKKNDCKWCGHIKHWLFESIKDYGLSQDSIDLIKEEIKQTKEKNIDTLEWNHEEIAVLLIENKQYWVKSNLNWKQFFVYNSWYALELYEKIAEELLKKQWILYWIKDLWKKFFESWQSQFLTTWKKLAGWLPIYKLKLKNSWEILSLDKIWTVEKDEKVRTKVCSIIENR